MILYIIPLQLESHLVTTVKPIGVRYRWRWFTAHLKIGTWFTYLINSEHPVISYLIELSGDIL